MAKHHDFMNNVVSLISEPLSIKLSPQFKHRYRKLVYLDSVGKEQYLSSPVWRNSDSVSELPEQLNLFNLRSFWAAELLAALPNYIFISNTHNHVIEGVYNNLF